MVSSSSASSPDKKVLEKKKNLDSEKKSEDEQKKKKTLSLKEKYPEIYTQTNIDRRGCERVVPMEILSLGMGRTGTMCEFISCFFTPSFYVMRVEE